MRIMDDQERNILGGGLLLLAVAAAALGSALGVEALDHMAFAAGLCGPATGHCIDCFAAAGSLVLALAAGVASAALLDAGQMRARVRLRRRPGPGAPRAARPEVPSTTAAG